MTPADCITRRAMLAEISATLADVRQLGTSDLTLCLAGSAASEIARLDQRIVASIVAAWPMFNPLFGGN